MSKNKDTEEEKETKEGKEITVLEYDLSQNVCKVRTRLLVLSSIGLFSVLLDLKINLPQFNFSALKITEAFYLSLLITVSYLIFYFYFSIKINTGFFRLKRFIYKHGDKITEPYEEETLVPYGSQQTSLISEIGELNKMFLQQRESLLRGFSSSHKVQIRENKERKQYESVSKEYYDMIEIKRKNFDFRLPLILGTVSLIALYIRYFYSFF